MKRFSILCAFLTALTLVSTSAFAGPVWKFGPNDQGLLKIEYKGQFQFLHRDTGSEADGEGDTTEFNFRRNRIAFMGAYGKNFSIYFQTEYSEDRNIGPLTVTDGNGSNFQMLDAVFRFKVNPALNLWVGKFKQNVTRENLEACEAPLTLDRSVLIRSPFVGTRDKGVAVWGNLLENKFQYRLQVMNGRNDSNSAPESNLRYTARAHVTLLDAEKGYGYKGTYMGKKKVLTIGGSYQFEKDVAYADTVAQTGAVDYEAWSVDVFFEYPVEDMGTFTFSTAYVDYDLDDAYKGANPDSGVIGSAGEKNGGYTKVGYLLPNMPLQLFARAENWSFASLDDVVDQEIDWYGFGFNYYLRGQNLKATVEYSITDYDTETADIEDFDTLTAQLQVKF